MGGGEISVNTIPLTMMTTTTTTTTTMVMTTTIIARCEAYNRMTFNTGRMAEGREKSSMVNNRCCGGRGDADGGVGLFLMPLPAVLVVGEGQR